MYKIFLRTMNSQLQSVDYVCTVKQIVYNRKQVYIVFFSLFNCEHTQRDHIENKQMANLLEKSQKMERNLKKNFG